MAGKDARGCCDDHVNFNATRPRKQQKGLTPHLSRLPSEFPRRVLLYQAMPEPTTIVRYPNKGAAKEKKAPAYVKNQIRGRTRGAKRPAATNSLNLINGASTKSKNVLIKEGVLLARKAIDDQAQSMAKNIGVHSQGFFRRQILFEGAKAARSRKPNPWNGYCRSEIIRQNNGKSLRVMIGVHTQANAVIIERFESGETRSNVAEMVPEIKAKWNAMNPEQKLAACDLKGLVDHREVCKTAVPNSLLGQFQYVDKTFGRSIVPKASYLLRFTALPCSYTFHILSFKR